MGPGPVRLLDREGQPLRLQAHRGVIRPDALAVLRRSGKTPDRVKPADVLAWVHGIGKSGRTPSATTVGARIACLSCFYRFLIRMGLVVSQPVRCGRAAASHPVGRPRIQRRRGSPAPRGRAGHHRRPAGPGHAVDVHPDRTTPGRGDRPDRRRHQPRGRDGLLLLSRQGRQARSPRTPPPCLRGALRHAGRCRQGLGVHGARGVALAGGARPEGVTSGTFYARFRRYLAAAGLAPTGIHVLRHTAAKLRRDAGRVDRGGQRFLDHSSLAVTTVYLRRLEGQEDRAWRDVAEAIGV